MNGAPQMTPSCSPRACGADTLNGFDANLAAAGRTCSLSQPSASPPPLSASSVLIQDLGANTPGHDRADPITLNGVNGTTPNVINQADFILAP